MTSNEFIMEVKAEIKGSCALPYSIPDKEIIRIIKQAKKWFYTHYEGAVEPNFYVINPNVFNSNTFKKTRKIKLPKCVVNVIKVEETNGARLSNVFNESEMIANDLYQHSTDPIVMRTAEASFWDLTRAFVVNTVATKFNPNSKILYFKGRTPKKPLFIETLNQLEDEDLFDDWYFIRYVTAQVKIALGRILGFFEYQLVGGITINSDSIKSEGEDELAEIKENIDELQPPDWLILWH